ncbi:hypothetical protein EYF80_053059 [Liparis tanakae]|uniref:Uncharacterized protein n=1 Tax=Liparis tanakae TaxID=230148 RepID=A0A4Z2F6I4_9TELE|nr:hypothetical protein EYF80_053059 [Liparis tanakae]
MEVFRLPDSLQLVGERERTSAWSIAHCAASQHFRSLADHHKRSNSKDLSVNRDSGLQLIFGKLFLDSMDIKH